MDHLYMPTHMAVTKNNPFFGPSCTFNW